MNESSDDLLEKMSFSASGKSKEKSRILTYLFLSQEIFLNKNFFELLATPNVLFDIVFVVRGTRPGRLGEPSPGRILGEPGTETSYVQSLMLWNQ